MSEFKHRILGIAKKIETFTDPEIGETFYFRRMTGHERDQYNATAFKADADAKTVGEVAYQALKPLLLSLTLCDQDGKRVFQPDELMELDALLLDRLNAKAMELNAMTEAVMAALEKKLIEARTGSGSSSATDSATKLTS